MTSSSSSSSDGSIRLSVILVTVLLIAFWPGIKEGGLVASMVISSGGAPPGARLGEQLWRELTWPFRWRTYCGWEAW